MLIKGIFYRFIHNLKSLEFACSPCACVGFLHSTLASSYSPEICIVGQLEKLFLAVNVSACGNISVALWWTAQQWVG